MQTGVKKRVRNEGVCNRFFIKELSMKRIALFLTIVFTCVVGNVAASDAPVVAADLLDEPASPAKDATEALAQLSVAGQPAPVAAGDDVAAAASRSVATGDDVAIDSAADKGDEDDAVVVGDDKAAEGDDEAAPAVQS